MVEYLRSLQLLLLLLARCKWRYSHRVTLKVRLVEKLSAQTCDFWTYGRTTLLHKNIQFGEIEEVLAEYD